MSGQDKGRDALDLLIIADIDRDHPTVDIGADRDDARLDVSVFGGDEASARRPPAKPNQNRKCRQHAEQHKVPPHPPPARHVVLALLSQGRYATRYASSKT